MSETIVKIDILNSEIQERICPDTEILESV